MTSGVAAPPSEDRLRGALLPILHAVQAEFDCIDPAVEPVLADAPIMHVDGFVQGHRHAGAARGDPGGRDPRRDPGDGWPVTDPAVRLAAGIALQFRPRPPAEAAAAIAEHIPAFWDPRMCRALLTAVAVGADLGPLVRDAAPTLRSPS